MYSRKPPSESSVVTSISSLVGAISPTDESLPTLFLTPPDGVNENTVPIAFVAMSIPSY